MPEKYIEINPASSLQFYKVEETDQCEVLPTFENTDYPNSGGEGYFLQSYVQKFTTEGTITNQFNSAYANNTVNLYSADGTLVSSNSATLNQSNLYEEKIKRAGFMRTDTGSIKRIYFQFEFPNITLGDTITLSGGQATFNGDHTVLNVLFDSDLNKNYLTINAAGTLFLDQANFDVFTYQGQRYAFYYADIAKSEGEYYVEISGTEGINSTLFRSNLFSVSDTHSNTIKIEATIPNNLNYYLTQLSIRIDGYLFKRNPKGEQEVYYNGDKMVKIDGKSRRFVMLEITKCPPWMHEKLGIALSAEVVTINGIDYSTDETYEPEYIDQSGLASGLIELEEINWL